MSLVGNLEDLGLGEILQIVSLSRKSGILSLQNHSREGKIFFHNGQVIRATSSAFRENLGDLLMRKGVVDVDTLKKALFLQRQSDPPPRIGQILWEHMNVSREVIEETVKEQVERIVYSFFGWPEGTFSFELGESGDLVATHLNPLQFMLEQGLNPQWLAMEGSRLVDEKRHRGESLEEEGDEPFIEIGSLLHGEAEAAPCEESSAPNGSTVFLIDDDKVTRERLGAILSKRGFAVFLFEKIDEYVPAIRAANHQTGNLILVIDLIMPRPDGSGILGGMDLLEQIRSEFPHLQVVMISDHPNPEMERKVRQLGAPAVMGKPRKSEVREERGERALEALGSVIAELNARTGKEERPPDAAMFNLGAELMAELGVTAPVGSIQKSPGLHLLRGMLQELSNPSLGGGIILLVLRFASEFMNRAVVFLVKEDVIVGLGQFGIELASGSADHMVRRMKISTAEPSIFNTVLREMGPLKSRMGSTKWDLYLEEQLGGEIPEEVFLGPVISEGKTVAVLYGDNLPGKKPVGDTAALEIFLSQAGLAMEKALLERRLRGKDSF
jgi:FixJ family two-component response regulator